MRRSLLAVAMTLALIPAGVGATAQASTAAPAAGPAVAFSCPFYENGRTFYATTIFYADNCFSTPKSTMYMQADGNLVLFNEYGDVMWASGTWGYWGAYAVMQDDGNFVIYYYGYPIWASNTDGHPGARLILNFNGNLLIRDVNNVKLWHTNTAH
jgi:hypothetical protein